MKNIKQLDYNLHQHIVQFSHFLFQSMGNWTLVGMDETENDLW